MSRTTGTSIKDSKLEKLISEGNILTEVLSYEDKSAKDFEWCERCADFIDGTFTNFGDEDRLRRLKINYDLANGRGDSLMELDSQFKLQEIEEEILHSGTNPVRHIPVINQVYDAMIGEQMQASLKYTAVDTSGYSTTMRQKKKLELNQEFIRQNAIAPLEQQIAKQVMIENGITQQTQLSPDQQQDLQSDIQKRLKFRLVEDIDKFMAQDYKTPVETEVQKLVNWLVKYCDIKYITDENFKNVVITGSEIYKIYIRNGNPGVSIVNPLGFKFHSSKQKLFIDQADVISHREAVTFQDVLTWHGTELYNGKYKDKLNTMKRYSNHIDNLVATRPGEMIIKSHPAINTEEGQSYAKMLHAIFGGSGVLGDINYCDYSWKSFGKLKAITRKEKNGLRLFYVDENYEFNPLKGDVEETIEIVPQIYTTKKISNDIYVEKGPLPYQYRSPNNPFDVRMNYVGAMYNTMGGNSDNLAPIDLGKPWQNKINIQMAKIEEIDRKSRGPVLAMQKRALPNKSTIGQWLNMLNNENILLLDDTAEGLNSQDMNAIKVHDMSNLSELQGRLPFLEFLTRQMSLSMGFNPSRLGLQNPNLPVSNNRQNIVQSTIQTEYIYRTHNKVIENVINNLVNVAKISLKDNPVKASYVLDDMSIAELELDSELLDIAEQNVFVTNSIEDQQSIERVNNLAQPLVQNGQIDFEDAIKMSSSKNMADLINVAKDSIRKNEARMQQKQEMDSQNMQQQSQMAQQLEQMKFEMELEKQKRDLENRQIVATIQSLDRSNALDVNRNQISDTTEDQIRKLDFERDKLSKELALKDKELNQTKIIKMKELEVKRQQIKAKPKAKN